MPKSPDIIIHSNAFLGLALLLLIADLRWIFAVIISICVHELCHLLALYSMNCTVQQVSIGLTGAKIITGPLSRKQELLSSLAGPVGGLILTLSGAIFPRIAICAFFHSIVNLLPLYPLDGGRVLRCILPDRIHPWAEAIVAAAIALFAIKFVGLLGLIAAIVVIGRFLLEKYLAKNRPSGYNIPTIK